MGRRSHCDVAADFDGTVSLTALPINSGGYDQGGHYFGCGSDRIGYMYRAYFWDGEGNSIDMFVRGVTRRDAKQKVQARLPKVRFYR